MKKPVIFSAILFALQLLPLCNAPDLNSSSFCAVGLENDVFPFTSKIHRSKSTVQYYSGQSNSLIDTLTWRKEGASKIVNFPFSEPGDSLLVWLKPLAGCSLLAIRFRPMDWEGNMLLDIWDASNYDPLIYSSDSTDGNGWWGKYSPDGCPSCWIPGDIVGHTPLGWMQDDPHHHYWGSYPVAVTAADSDSWVEIPADVASQGKVDLGRKPFYIGAAFYPLSGRGFYAQEPYEGGRPFSFFKYYPEPELDPTFGWFLRSYFPWFEAIVKYYEPATSIQEDSNEPICSSFQLFQNYPNPFNPLTSITYSLPEATNIRLQVYDTLGQVVAVLVDGQQAAGHHQVQWNAADMASGIYFFGLTVGSFTATKRMVLMK